MITARNPLLNFDTFPEELFRRLTVFQMLQHWPLPHGYRKKICMLLSFYVCYEWIFEKFRLDPVFFPVSEVGKLTTRLPLRHMNALMHARRPGGPLRAWNDKSLVVHSNARWNPQGKSFASVSSETIQTSLINISEFSAATLWSNVLISSTCIPKVDAVYNYRIWNKSFDIEKISRKTDSICSHRYYPLHSLAQLRTPIYSTV